MSCECSTPESLAAYIACAAVTPQPLADDGTITTFAAQAGCSSQGVLPWTLCVGKAFIYTRRFIYWQKTPGDCGTAPKYTASAASGAATGAGAFARVDPEPISKSILAGLAAIFGGFGAAHAQAVATEEQTLCSVAVNFNQAITQLEQAVKSGQISPDQASSTLDQVCAALDPVMAQIQKTSGDAAAGYRICLRALNQFMDQIGFPALAPSNALAALSGAVSAPLASPGAPGTYQAAPPVAYPLPGNAVGSPALYSGASGGIVTPLTGNNAGVGVTSFPTSPTVAVSASASGGFPWGIILVVVAALFLVSRKSEATA